MKENFAVIMGQIFGHEGGFTNSPKDPGNWDSGIIGKGKIVGTNYGITGRTLEGWRRRTNPKYEVTQEHVRKLSKAEAWEILGDQYWRPIKGDDLPAGLDLAVMDFAVNAGPAQAVKVLQKVLGVARDGVMGNVTLGAIARANVHQLLIKYMDAQLAYKRSLRGLWKTYGRGWTNRAMAVKAVANKMAQRGGATPTEIAAARVEATVDLAGGSVDDILAPATDLPKAAPSETPVLSTSAGQSAAVALAASVAVMCTQVSEVLEYLPPETKWLPVAFAVVGAIGAAAALYVKVQNIRNGAPQ